MTSVDQIQSELSFHRSFVCVRGHGHPPGTIVAIQYCNGSD